MLEGVHQAAHADVARHAAPASEATGKPAAAPLLHHDSIAPLTPRAPK